MYVFGIREKSTGYFFPMGVKAEIWTTSPCACDGREKKIHLFTTTKSGLNFLRLWTGRNSRQMDEFEIVVFTLSEAGVRPIHHPAKSIQRSLPNEGEINQ